MPLSDCIQALRLHITNVQAECERVGDMHPVHAAAWACFDDNKTSLTLREAFALGEVYNASSIDSALYAIDELAEE